MGQNEIRLRRNPISAGKIHRHQNYSALMRKHGRYLKLKKMLYVLYVVIFVILFGLLFMVIHLQKKHGRTLHQTESTTNTNPANQK